MTDPAGTGEWLHTTRMAAGGDADLLVVAGTADALANAVDRVIVRLRLGDGVSERDSVGYLER